MHLINQGHKVAVLAVDPSSERSKGSILGDKTRMENLSSQENAFIRPSPSAGTLGGVTRKTRETIILCEAAGYDMIFIETVGVGQSEVAVKSMVDFFLLLMLAGAGDELQGIKRGIMEMADAILINKADNDNLVKAKSVISIYQNALHFFPSPDSEWLPIVMECSAITGHNIPEIYNMIKEYEIFIKKNSYFTQNRQQQQVKSFYQSIDDYLRSSFYSNIEIKKLLIEFEELIKTNKISPYEAAKMILKK
jgi:LAO/AO transport system kinase